MYLKMICKHEMIDMFLFVSFVIFCSNYVISIPQQEFYNPGLQEVEGHEPTTKGPSEQSKPSNIRFHRLSKIVNKLSKKNKTTPTQRTIEVKTNAVPRVEGVTNVELPINSDISNPSTGSPQLDKQIDVITEEMTELTATVSTESMANKVQAVISNAVKEVSSNAKGTISKVGQKVSDTLNSGVSKITGRVCFKHIGCFASYEDYEDVIRQPISLLPMSPDLIDCTFNIFSTKSGSIPRSFKYNATSDDLLKSSFDPNFKTVVITHGYRSGFEPWIRVRTKLY